MIELSQVTYTYPFQQTPAVKEISLTVNKGEVTLVTGASGCGKSTLVRLINGLCPNFFNGTLTGDIRRNGTPGNGKTLQEISADVGTVFQDPELQFFALNVDDEIAFAHEWQGKTREEIQNIVAETAGRLRITHILGSSIHDLSEGQKQKVALGAVLSLRPSIVVLDEPSANLDPESTLELAGLIRDLKKQDIAVLVADHRLYWLKDVVDRIIVMKDGEVAVEGDFSILENPALRETYGLRRHAVTDVRNTLPPVPEEGRLKMKHLTFAYKNAPPLYTDAAFTLPQGVTGIIGDNGTGKTTLARILTGLTRLKLGELSIDGTAIHPKKIMKRAGIILQNTDHQLHMNTVLQEVAMASGIHPKKNRLSKAELLAFLDRFGLKHLAARHPQSLSGGEKQRLVIACGLVRKPDIFILDEPTSGLDGRNMRRIADMIHSAAEGGMSVVVITHDLELLERVCDAALRLPFTSVQKETTND
ncbi:MAG: ABC transporter [Deltaproteobacteria bacterium]|nr:MAG: ABC transporter [Deltaproteobacteria bacterium]